MAGKTRIIHEFEKVKEKHSDLYLHPLDDGAWEILGNLHFLGKLRSETIEDIYSLRIYIPSVYPKELPKVWELGGRIPKDFHKFSDESLCLGASLDVKIKFHEHPNLLGFVERSVVEYLFGYSYKLKHGELPVGERSHGLQGVIEHYKELFSTQDLVVVVKLLEALVCETYQADRQCPCCSGKTLKQCHGETLSNLLHFQALEDYIVDFININRVFVFHRNFLQKDLHRYLMSIDRRQNWIEKVAIKRK